MEINTIVKLDLIDGTQVDMTLTYGKLLKARSKYPEAYEAYNKIEMNGPKEIFDFLDVIYMGYLCANLEAPTIMSKDDFMEKITTNRKSLLRTYSELLYPKKKEVSETLSGDGRKAAKRV